MSTFLVVAVLFRCWPPPRRRSAKVRPRGAGTHKQVCSRCDGARTLGGARGGACTCAPHWSHVALLGFVLRVGFVAARHVLPRAMSGVAVMLPEWTAGITLLGLLTFA